MPKKFRGKAGLQLVKLYRCKPINRLAAHGLSGRKGAGWTKNEKPPVLINMDRLPDNSNEQRKWELRQGVGAANLKKQKDQGGFRLDAVKKLVVMTCLDPYGGSTYVVGGFCESVVSVFRLRYIRGLSQRVDCWPFLEEFTNKRRAECAAVLLARRLGVRVARGIAESVSESDLAFYYPVESREGGAQ